MISVIIAAYNAEKYIEECLESVLDQTFQDLEVLVVDDGSTDNTGRIIREFCQRDERIVYIYQDNQGPAAARNAALEVMKGEYFTVVDADDKVENTCYESAWQAVQKTDADMVIWGYLRFTEKRIIPQRDPMLKQGIYRGIESKALWENFIYREKYRMKPFLPCHLIRSSIIKENGLRLNSSLKRSEDYLFLGKVYYLCDKIYSMSNKMFCMYRQNESSITHNYVSGYFDMVTTIYDELMQFAVDHDALTLCVRNKLDRMLVYRTIMAIENEAYNNADKREKKKNVAHFIKDKNVKCALKRIGVAEGKRLYGNKFFALKLGIPFLLSVSDR